MIYLYVSSIFYDTVLIEWGDLLKAKILGLVPITLLYLSMLDQNLLGKCIIKLKCVLVYMQIVQMVSVLSLVFQSLLKVLESPNSWDAFRRAGGFTGLLSLVTDMEGALSNPPQGEVWKSLGHQPLVDHLLLTLHILSVVVHLHTANAHHFETGGFYEKLAEALLQLGCFHAEGSGREKWVGEKCSCPWTGEENQAPGKSFYQLVDLAESPVASASPSTPQPNLPLTLQTCIRLLSFLDQFATGTYSPQKLNLGPEREDGCDDNKRKSNGTAAHEGVYSGSPPAHLGSGSQSMEDKQGSSRNMVPRSPSVCTESQYRWIFHFGGFFLI